MDFWIVRCFSYVIGARSSFYTSGTHWRRCAKKTVERFHVLLGCTRLCLLASFDTSFAGTNTLLLQKRFEAFWVKKKGKEAQFRCGEAIHPEEPWEGQLLNDCRSETAQNSFTLTCLKQMLFVRKQILHEMSDADNITIAQGAFTTLVLTHELVVIGCKTLNKLEVTWLFSLNVSHSQATDSHTWFVWWIRK